MLPEKFWISKSRGSIWAFEIARVDWRFSTTRGSPCSIAIPSGISSVWLRSRCAMISKAPDCLLIQPREAAQEENRDDISSKKSIQNRSQVERGSDS